MNKLAALLTIGLAFAQSWRCPNDQYPEGPPPNVEMQRQEIIVLEREAARAIQLNDRTFFRRVYADDFTGTLSHGQPVDKTQMVNVVQAPAIPTLKSAFFKTLLWPLACGPGAPTSRGSRSAMSCASSTYTYTPPGAGKSSPDRQLNCLRT